MPITVTAKDSYSSAHLAELAKSYGMKISRADAFTFTAKGGRTENSTRLFIQEANYKGFGSSYQVQQCA